MHNYVSTTRLMCLRLAHLTHSSDVRRHLHPHPHRRSCTPNQPTNHNCRCICSCVACRYVFAALNLYIDIVQLFLYLLRLFGNNRD